MERGTRNVEPKKTKKMKNPDFVRIYFPRSVIKYVRTEIRSLAP